jgi:hypothetical protein
MSKHKDGPTIKIICDGNVLRCHRVDRDGSRLGTSYGWEIGPRSYLPQLIYYVLHGYIRRSINQIKDKNFASVRKAVLQALCDAARTCGCKPRFDREGGDVTWYLKGKPFFAFQIHEPPVDQRRAKKMIRGNTILRWAVEIRKNGIVHHDPRKTGVRVARD